MAQYYLGLPLAIVSVATSQSRSMTIVCKIIKFFTAYNLEHNRNMIKEAPYPENFFPFIDKIPIYCKS